MSDGNLAPGGPLLRLSDLTVRFGGLVALSGIRLDLLQGETVGVIGPNGSGKTTLINSLTRLVSIERGATMMFGDTNLLRLGAHQLAHIGIARTFQSVEMCTTDSILRSVVIGAARSVRGRDDSVAPGSGPLDRAWPGRRDRPRLEDRAARLLADFGIAEWSGAMTREVPYGVGKRAQICRALMAAPRLLLLDEPASGMTAGEKQQLSQAISALKSRLGFSILIIEHDVAFLASGLCDRLIALDSGELIASGTPDEVRRHPQVITAYLGEDHDEEYAREVGS